MNRKLQMAVLSISMITILGSTAVSPALAGIKTAFPMYSDATIQLILTIPPLFIIPSCFLCNVLAQKWGKKRVLIFGVILYLIGGMGAGLMPGFYSMLVMRAVLGVACGLITPMAQALISSNFEGETRAKLTGYSASASYLMGIIASFTVANLAAVNWRLAFLIYIVAVLVLVLNAKYLPADPPARAAEKRERVKRPVNWRAYLVILGMAAVNVAFYTFSTSIALFLKSESIGNDVTSGYTVAVFMAAGFLMGIAVPRVRNVLRYFTVTLGCVMMGVGYVGLALSSNLGLLILASALIGASYSVFYSSVFLKVGALSRDGRENTKLVTFTTAGMFLGQTVSVYLLQGAELLFRSGGYRFRFAFLAGALLLAAVLCVVNYCFNARKNKAAV
ncbi:MAG: MFS transporter [Oscillospiraceae bacterium]